MSRSLPAPNSPIPAALSATTRRAWLGDARLLALAAIGSGAAVAALCAYLSFSASRVAAEPRTPWRSLADIAAVSATVGVVAYIATRTQRALPLRSQMSALSDAQNRVALELELLSTTLNQIDAGLEVVAARGVIVWRNKRAEELAPFAADAKSWEGAPAPYERGDRPEETHGRRFRVHLPAGERVYERHELPLEPGKDGASRTMNLYLDRTSATLAEQQLLLAERLASLGRVAQGVAHELNTPLATIRTLATDMREALRVLRAQETTAPEREKFAADMDESASLIAEETRRLGRITQSLLAGGDLVRPTFDGQVRLAAVVERACALVFAGVQDGPEVRVDADVDELSVAADPDRLVQVLVNLLQNAYDAVSEQGAQVAIRACRQVGVVALIIEDDGAGIDPAMRARLFEPFATTKPPGQGTGLGLYTSYMLVHAMAGSLTLEPRESGGTRATVRLPAAATRRHRTPHRPLHLGTGEQS